MLWETTMYRPQLYRVSHTIDLDSLQYTVETVLQIDQGPEMDEQKSTGCCRRIEGPAGTGSPGSSG
jgi:hypothetical protein